MGTFPLRIPPFCAFKVGKSCSFYTRSFSIHANGLQSSVSHALDSDAILLSITLGLEHLCSKLCPLRLERVMANPSLFVQMKA